jgi:20S proteasome alpha/beta subunit
MILRRETDTPQFMGPYRRKLREGSKGMTIAAGFVSQGGILLCSDTLISGGDVNMAQKKIWALNLPKMSANVAFAFAGTVHHCRTVISKAYHALNALDPQTDGPLTDLMVMGVLENVLTTYHIQHLYKHPSYRYSDGPSVHLLVAIQWPALKSVSLFGTYEDTVTKYSDYALIGSGESIARYIIEPLAYLPVNLMPRKHVLLLADHMLHQVKRFVPGCGDASQFQWLGEDGSFHGLSSQLLLPALYSGTFRRIIADLFYAAADLDREDRLVSLGLELTDNRIKEIRAEQRAEKKRREALGNSVGLSELPVIASPVPLTQRVRQPRPSGAQKSKGQK